MIQSPRDDQRAMAASAAGIELGDFRAGRPSSAVLNPRHTREACARRRASARRALRFCLSLPAGRAGRQTITTCSARRRRSRTRDPLTAARSASLQANPRFHDVYSDDYVTLYTQFSTQWDALAHVGLDVRRRRRRQSRRCALQRLRRRARRRAHGETGLQARGCSSICGARSAIRAGSSGYDDLMRRARCAARVVESGDVLCLHTGQSTCCSRRARTRQALARRRVLSSRRLRRALLRWIDDSAIAAIAADNFAVEAVPPARATTAWLRALARAVPVKLGMPLGELWYLAELARWLARTAARAFCSRRRRCGCRAPSARPVTPVATV
jgi:hypothetical protein